MVSPGSSSEEALLLEGVVWGWGVEGLLLTLYRVLGAVWGGGGVGVLWVES